MVNCDGVSGLWVADENTGDLALTESLIQETGEDGKNTILEADLEEDCDALCTEVQLGKMFK